MKNLIITLFALMAITTFANEEVINFGAEGIVSEFEATKGTDHDTLYYKNKCWKTIWTAVHYMDLDGDWVTGAWYKLKPGDSAIVAKTQNRIYYIYAESDDGEYTWSGDIHINVRNNGSFGFVKREITTNDWGTWTQNFTCN